MKLTEVADVSSLANGGALPLGPAHDRRRELWLSASREVAGELASGGEPAASLRLIAERARAAAGAPVSGICLPAKEDPSVLVFEVIDGESRAIRRLSGLRIPMAGSGSGEVFTTGSPMIFDNYGTRVTQHSPQRSYPTQITLLDSCAAVPMAMADEVLGVLLLARFRGDLPFSGTELAMAQSYAAQAAVAWQFARAVADRRRLAVLEDRDRIARDLHDLIIQRLFAIGLGLEGLAGVPGAPAEQLGGFARQLDQTIRDIRRTIFSLQEPDTTQGSLRSELLRIAGEATAALSFEPRVGFDGPLDTLVPELVWPDLLATLREALANAARHAHATEVSADVSVDRAGRWLRLVVLDDGIGVAPEPDRHSGLANLAYRARRWRGTFSIGPRAGGGTELRWSARLPRTSTAPALPARGRSVST